MEVGMYARPRRFQSLGSSVAAAGPAFETPGACRVRKRGLQAGDDRLRQLWPGF